MDAAHSTQVAAGGAASVCVRGWRPVVCGGEGRARKPAAPAIVFNRSLSIIKAVAGSEINGRQEIHYLPRTLDDAGVQ